jgi:DNA-binding NtrC family response regulator
VQRAVVLTSVCGGTEDLSSLLRCCGFETIRSIGPKWMDHAVPRVQQEFATLLVLNPTAIFQEDAITLLGCVRRIDRALPVFLVAAAGNEDLAVAALWLAVTDYFKDPLRWLHRLLISAGAANSGEKMFER